MMMMMLSKNARLSIIAAISVFSIIIFHQSLTYSTSSQDSALSKFISSPSNKESTTIIEDNVIPNIEESEPERETAKPTERFYNYDDVKIFTSQVLQLMQDFKPLKKAGKVRGANCQLETLRVDPDYEGPVYSKKHLEDCVVVNFDVYEDLKFKHAQFLANLPTKFPDNMYEDNSRGIVMVGGAHYSMLGYLVIRILRQQGTTLPIEVFMPPGANDQYYCEKVLPKYNAKCITLERVVSGKIIEQLDIKGYQLKSLAFLSSSFNEMLYIDSDNYPLHDIEPIFESELFQNYGMIGYPDFWRRATAPIFYDIAGINVGKQVRFGVDTVTNKAIFDKMDLDLDQEVSFHDRLGTVPEGTSESSAIFMNKKTHLKTLLLSMYYNIYGPENYYSLLSQDTFGEGDKETFSTAAHVVGDQYWQVKTRAQPGGALLHQGKRPRSTTMLQYDPVKDFEIYNELKTVLADVKQDSYDKMRVPNYYNEHNKQIAFVHYNLGKLQPLTMIGWNRRYGYDLTDIGFDFELRNVELMVEMFCSNDENERVEFEYVMKSGANDLACQESQNLFNRMSATKDKVITDKADLSRLEPFSNI